MKNPKLIVKPFAKNGQKNVIPENYETSMDSNQATWDQGFGQITMLPVAAGGLPPKGQDFNGILNQISENIVYQSQGGRFKFSADYAASINGYPKGAILQSDDEKKEYQSIIDNNKVNFNTATQSQINTAWKLISTDDILEQIAGKQPSGNYALKGDSYTKTESDGRYQPKGNYAPAGDYATNAALNNGLNQKFDKTEVVETTGSSTTKVMSQKAVTDAFQPKGSYALKSEGYPIGAPIPWPQATAPAGYLACNGQSFNKTTYPLLAKAYPTGVLPDLRGEFIRGLDAGREIDSGRVVLSAQSDAIRDIEGGFTIDDQIQNANYPPFGAFKVISGTVNYDASSDTQNHGRKLEFKASNVVPTANENRPRNIAFLYIVRAA